MRRLRLVLAALLCSVARPAVAAPSATLVFLQASRPELDDRALADAVSIYTRDLGLTLETEGGAPSEITAESLGVVLARVRAAGRRGAFWYRVRSDMPGGAVVLYVVATHDSRPTVHALRVTGLATAGLYRALALKLRAVLTDSLAAEPEEPTPAPAVPTVATTPPPSAPSVAAAPAYRPRLLVDVAYALTVPVDVGLLRHGLAVDAAVPFGRRWELHLGIEVSSAAGRTIASGSASLFDVPIRLGGRILIGSRRFRFGIGPLLTLHALSVSATGFDGTTGHRLDAAAGLGGELVGRVRISDHVGALFAFRAEEVLPNLHFMLHGQTALDGGGPLFTIAAGIELAAP